MKHYPENKKPAASSDVLLGVDEDIILDNEKVEVAADQEAVEKKPVENEHVGKPGDTNCLVNMRKEPNLGSSILEVVQAKTRVMVYENPGDFYRVACDGKEGYIIKTAIDLA